MRRTSWIICVVAMVLLVSPAFAQNITGGQVAPIDQAFEAHVTSVTLDPETFFPSDTGTVTIELSNSGNQTVSLTHPALLSNNIRVLNSDAYTTVIRLGPGNSMTYTFLVAMNSLDGTYFPLFSVSVIGGMSISYPFKLEIDSKNLSASIVDKPDTFSYDKKSSVNLSVANRRRGTLENIQITTSGEGIQVIPEEIFIPTLSPGSSDTIAFQVTPNRGSAPDLVFHVTYQNGNNEHSLDVVLPVNIGEDKTAVVPVINNIAVVSQGSYYHMTGNANNAGVSDALSLVLTVDPPARPVEPYASYSVGTLTSGDYSSFDLTFESANLSYVPLRVTWKNSDGTSFSSVQVLDLRTVLSGSSGTYSGSGSPPSTTRPGGVFGFGGGSGGGGIGAFYPVIVLVIVVIAAAVLWKERKRFTGRKKQR